MRKSRIFWLMPAAILLLSLAFAIKSETAGIYNNSGTSGGDSISISFYALDSAGNVVAMASGDSVFLYTFFPDGSLASEDSAAYNGTKITAKTRHGFTVYSWKDAIADIDGGTATEGVYGYLLIVKDNTGAALETAHRGNFQLYASKDFDAVLDDISATLDTAHETHATVDSVYDSINNSATVAEIADGVWDEDSTGHYTSPKMAFVASQTSSSSMTPEEIADSVWGRAIADLAAGKIGRLLYDSLMAVIDSLQNQDNWVAKEATVNGIDDEPWDNPTRTLTTADWTTDADITQLKTDLATDHGSGSWQTASGFATASQLYALAIISGYDLGSRSVTRYNQAVDTTFVYDETTLKARIIAWHVGGEAGDFPDSTRVDSVGTW